MPTNFALPVAHQTSEDYAAFNGAIVAGRPYRQPLENVSDPLAFVDGLELFLKNTGTTTTAYAMTDGILRAIQPKQPASLGQLPGPEQNNRLNLKIDPRSVQQLTLLRDVGALHMAEAPPTEVVYENIDFSPSGKTPLVTLLHNAYLGAAALASTPNYWHPAMRMNLTIFDSGAPGSRSKKKFKEHIDEFPTEEQQINRLSELVIDFLSGGGTLNSIPVRTGDPIGVARIPQFWDSVPAALPADFDPRRITLRMTDACDQSVNPLYYLHILINRFLRPGSDLKLLTNITSLAHPFFALYPALSALDPPRARMQLGDDTPFPLGAPLPHPTRGSIGADLDLATFHGSPAYAPVSALEWRYNPLDGTFEAQARVSGTAVPQLTPSPDEIALVNTVGGLFTHEIGAIADRLQIPAALIVALVGATSLPGGSFDDRFVMLEPFSDEDRTRLGNPSLASLYDDVVSTTGVTSNVVVTPSDGIVAFDLTLTAGRNWIPRQLVDRGASVISGGNRFPVIANTGVADPAQTQTTFTLTVANPTGASFAIGAVTILEGFNTSAPLPWNGAAPVRSGKALTWNQLVTIIEATGGRHASVGLVRITLARAIEAFTWLNKTQLFSDLSPSTLIIPPTIPSPGELLQYSGSDGLMLIGTSGLLVAAVCMRLEYSGRATCFDIPKALEALGSKYYANSNKERDPGFEADPLWNTLAFAEYVAPVARLYNAVFATGPFGSRKFVYFLQ